MFYSNIRLQPRSKGGKYGLFFEDCQIERDDLFLPVSEDLKTEFGGFKGDLNIRVFNDIPFILPERSTGLFLLLATTRDPSEKGHGKLEYLGTQSIDFVCRPYIRKFGTEKIYIVRANGENAFKVTWGGERGKGSQTFYFVKNKKVIAIQQYEGVQRMLNEINIHPPIHRRSRNLYDLNEWRSI